MFDKNREREREREIEGGGGSCSVQSDGTDLFVVNQNAGSLVRGSAVVRGREDG